MFQCVFFVIRYFQHILFWWLLLLNWLNRKVTCQTLQWHLCIWSSFVFLNVFADVRLYLGISFVGIILCNLTLFCSAFFSVGFPIVLLLFLGLKNNSKKKNDFSFRREELGHIVNIEYLPRLSFSPQQNLSWAHYVYLGCLCLHVSDYL